MPLICRDIMTRNPACCEPHNTVQEVARLMRSRNVGSVPVVENLATMTLVGIVTDRDLTLKVTAEARDPHTVTVGEVMTPKPIHCAPDDDVQKALETMARNQVRRLPVVDGVEVVGIIAQADIATRLNVPADTAALVERISKEWKDM